MTSHEDVGFLRRTLRALGRALRRGILGRASPEHMKQFTASDEYWDRVIAAQLGWPLEQPGPSVGDTPRDPWEPEYEPVHGWTSRQLKDYLRRNPGYRPAYEAELQLRCHARVILGAGAPEDWEKPPGGEVVAAPVPEAAARMTPDRLDHEGPFCTPNTKVRKNELVRIPGREMTKAQSSLKSILDISKTTNGRA
jgi:hypothetical protein